MALVYVRRAYFYAPARRRVFVELAPVDHQNIEKYEIKKQVIGEDPDFEKSGRTLSRVIEWNRDGITIEADQRHVRDDTERSFVGASESLCDTMCRGKKGRRQRGEPTWTGTDPD